MEESTQDLSAILRKNLDRPIHMELESRISPAHPIPKAGQNIDRTDCTFLQLLQSKDAPLNQLIMLKNFAKANLNHPENKLPRPIFTVIYYASIAAALSLHDKRISTLQDGALKIGMEWGIKLGWVGREIELVLQAGLNWLQNHGKD
jgi:hypothetical protein